ncbi:MULTISPECIES: SagB/ThcOx family dehydrogenase [Amycolatopsis]|uniref:SagB/ThcOx family dehydrogenase n=1 Tax=Amycolatopsis albidoflavus TaxID=102226 RepID=A0ABW5I4Q6_9PSEU
MTTQELWDQLTHPPAPEDELWSVFHENSKTTRHFLALPDAAVLARMRQLHETLEYAQYPAVPLPERPRPLTAELGPVLRGRTSVREFAQSTVDFDALASVLHHAYAVNRPAGGGQPRSFRTTPSPGGLYPLEVYLHATGVTGLRSGLYHYDPAGAVLRHLHDGDLTRDLAACYVQREIVTGARILVFLTAWFERATFKYGDRGYRFALLEAGHVAQNLGLAAAALGLGAVNLGGYFDHELDDLLRLDGVTASTVYSLALGPVTGDD